MYMYNQDCGLSVGESEMTMLRHILIIGADGHKFFKDFGVGYYMSS